MSETTSETISETTSEMTSEADVPVLSDSDMDKFKIAKNICETVYKEIKAKILEKNTLKISDLNTYGNKRIIELLSRIFKKEKNKGIAFPTCISLNNCLGNNLDPFYIAHSINDNDVVKVKLGVSISGHVNMLTETFVVGHNEEVEDTIRLLDSIQMDIKKMVKRSCTNDNIRMLIESKCAENGMFPIENCVSFQGCQNHLKTDDSKCIILNHKKKYDKEDILITEDNTCYEMLKNEIYHIQIDVMPLDLPVKIRSTNCYIYAFNEYHYSLKLKQSRLFYNTVVNDHKYYAFDMNNYSKDPKNKMGLKECLEKGILNTYPVLYVYSDEKQHSEKVPIVSKMFTIII